MELIIDSSNIEQIKELNDLLTITGVTTNPTILTKSGREAMDVVKDLCEVLSEDQTGQGNQPSIGYHHIVLFPAINALNHQKVSAAIGTAVRPPHG